MSQLKTGDKVWVLCEVTGEPVLGHVECINHNYVLYPLAEEIKPVEPAPVVKDSLTTELSNPSEKPGQFQINVDIDSVTEKSLGRIIEVRNYVHESWKQAELELVFPGTEFPFVARTMENTRDFPTNWRYARVIPVYVPTTTSSENLTPSENITVGYTVQNAYDPNEDPETKPIQRKRVLYIAGPMRGIAWFNYPMFDRVAKELRDAGNEVISPADEDRMHDDFDPFVNPSHAHPDACTFPKSMDFAKTVRRCIEAVLRCDEIVLLPGWENSQGALAELAIAAWMGKRVRQVDIDEQDRMTTKAVFMVNKCIAFSLSEAFWPNAVVFHETQKFISHFDEQHKDDEDIWPKHPGSPVAIAKRPTGLQIRTFAGLLECGLRCSDTCSKRAQPSSLGTSPWQ
jgi:hypothetical protein